MSKVKPDCKVEGCERTSRTRGYCPTHYEQFRKGKPITPIKSKRHRVEHGTLTMNARGCKCELCDGIRAAYDREKYIPAETTSLEHLHGTYRRYQNGCRCPECKKANAKGAIKIKYGLSEEQFKNLDALRLGRCDCCGIQATHQSRLVIDHDHNKGTKAIRGFICNKCNTGIGKLGDNIEGLQKALEYLQRYNTQ